MKIQKPQLNHTIPDHAKKVFEGVLFDVYQWEQELYDGSTATFERLRRPDTVVVFPVMNDGKILLTKQSQPGKENFIGATGGRMDPGEEVLESAKREMLEESGYEANTFILWDVSQPSSKIDWTVHTFVAKGLTKVADMNLDAGEKIELMPVTFDEFLEVGTRNIFAEREIVHYLYEAKIDKSKMKDLRNLFSI